MRGLAKLFAASPRDSHNALAVPAFGATSWHAPRSGGRRAPKGLMPFGFPQREKVAALSLCSSFREALHLQLLRARLKESHAHGSRTDSALAESVSYRLFPCDILNFGQKRFCFLCLPRVVAGRRAMRENDRCLSRLDFCSAAMPGRPPRVRPGAVLGYFLPRSKK